MALTIYNYDNKLFTGGFTLVILFVVDNKNDFKTVIEIIENHFAASCVGITLTMEDIKDIDYKTSIICFNGIYDSKSEDKTNITFTEISRLLN